MHVVVNAAMSADGKLSTHERQQIAISGESDFDRVDSMRADSDAILVGVGTVLADDPALTVKDSGRVASRRSRGLDPQPTRIVADSQARTPADTTVLDGEAKTIVLLGGHVKDTDLAKFDREGVDTIIAGDERVDLAEACRRLESRGIDRIMVEGGGELIFSLFKADLVEELVVYVGPTIIGGRDAPTLADGDGFLDAFPELQLQGVERIDDGVLLEWNVI